MPQRSNSARYLWGDRNPTDASLAYGANGVAPHGTTQRAIYTVPTARKAVLAEQHTDASITTVAAPAGLRRSWVNLQKGATSMELCKTQLGADKNAVGNYDAHDLGIGAYLFAGDILKIYTADASTGGTVDYSVTAVATEYDA